MEEVEDVKRERSCRTVDRCWEPACTEELDALGRGIFTTTARDDKTVNTGQVKNHEIVEGRRGGTCFAGVMPKLNDEAGSSERGVVEELSVPHL